MSPPRVHARLTVGLLAAALAVGVPGVDAQPAKPNYLPYEVVRPDDTPQHLAAKRAYNEAVQRYNQALYDYYLTLEQHDRLVDVHNNSSVSPAERKKARDQAQPLRLKLTELRGEVTARAAAVDQARRRAAEAGVTITR